MLLEVGEFCRRVENDFDRLLDQLTVLTGRGGESERFAWRASLSRAAYVLSDAGLSEFHLHVGQRGGVSLEYRLPASASWCDLVLLGEGGDRPAAVVVELKDWMTLGDKPGPREGLVWHKGALELHPSDQVRGYVEYCRRFHSTVQEAAADVSGCVYFTQPGDVAAYRSAPHDALVSEFPVFLEPPMAPAAGFVDFLRARLARPNMDFAERFERGYYKQDRGFCVQMARQIADKTSSPFVLLDHQRKGLELCLASVEAALASGDEHQKHVVVIEGPPGSGKSVVAARLWAELAQRIENVVITTTSSSQRRNWRHLFDTAGRGASWFVVPANRYAPADARWVGGYKKRNGKDKMRPDVWRKNIAACRDELGVLGPASAPLVSVVDEAHGLINPESKTARTPAGWPVAFGPQAYHIVRASRVSVFFLDGEQGFRDRENTSRADIEAWAKELGAQVAPSVSLAGAQFRAGGSTEYVQWVDHVLGMDPTRPRGTWRQTSSHPSAPLVFDIVPDPLALDDALIPHHRSGQSVRLLAAYGRPWLTAPQKVGKAGMPHGLPAHKKDFHIAFVRNGQKQYWSRVWNYVPDNDDYTHFVQAPPGSAMARDPLAEVGCPYVVRGFDYDWIGLLWLSDLVWRGNRWQVLLDHVHETGIQQTLQAARQEAAKHQEGPAYAQLVRRAQQAYRILLTRAMRGVYVWFEDEETRDHVLKHLPA